MRLGHELLSPETRKYNSTSAFTVRFRTGCTGAARGFRSSPRCGSSTQNSAMPPTLPRRSWKFLHHDLVGMAESGMPGR